MTDKIYKVTDGNILWSNHLQKYFYAGEAIDLSRSSPADISTLLIGGFIVEVQKPITKKEVNNG